MHMAEELLEIVDDQNKVIGIACRSDIHKKHLKHRSVHIFVFNSAGKLFLQKRVHTKDEFPGYFDSSAAGHVNPAESYHDAAARELKEELGINAQVEKVSELPASQATRWEFVWFYQAVTNDAVQPNPEEIADGKFYSLDDIQRCLLENDDKFTPSFQMLFDIYVQQTNLRRERTKPLG